MKKLNEQPASEFSIEVGSTGIRRVVIYADNAGQQARAHRLLASVATQMVLLDEALKQGERE